MAKGQMRSNREKKKPKQDKNKKKGAEVSGMHSQVKLGTSYMSDHVLVPLGRDPYCARSTLETEMPTGTVKWFNPTKGYGFIQPSGGGGKDVFVHISAVERAGLRSLNEGQTVEYEIQSERGKESATNLRVK